jgi:hypothetical protein
VRRYYIVPESCPNFSFSLIFLLSARLMFSLSEIQKYVKYCSIDFLIPDRTPTKNDIYIFLITDRTPAVNHGSIGI